MKIIVDELPKNCTECCFCRTDERNTKIKRCLLLNETYVYAFERRCDRCPLKQLEGKDGGIE